MKRGRILDLGRREFGEVWQLQKELVAQRRAGEIEDTLVLVEHPDVITLGRRLSAPANILSPGSIPVVEIERGGDVTYHGPGQLVGYPILLLTDDERDLHGYLRLLEEGLMAACGDLGLATDRNPGWTGVWTASPEADAAASGPRKLASIGIAVRRWVTMHGFALNVATDLSRFSTINPCGLDAAVMTSLARELGREVLLEEVKPRVVARLGESLQRSWS